MSTRTVNSDRSPECARSVVTPAPRHGWRAWCIVYALCVLLAVVVGTLCVLFLWSLDAATLLHQRRPQLLFLLPPAGLAVGLVYHRWGANVERGTNLVLDRIHEPGAGLPVRIVPLVLIGTVITHLFGGSAGREGTAVQIGGGVAGGFLRRFGRVSIEHQRLVLMAGVAAGFGGVFGTPAAGAIFAIEVTRRWKHAPAAAIPCMIGAFIADRVCIMLGATHVHYHIAFDRMHMQPWDFMLLGRVALAGICFGLAARLFSWTLHRAQDLFKAWIIRPYVRPLVGGVGVIGLALIFGADCLGLGVTNIDPSIVTISSSFQPGGAGWWHWILKIIFTAMTVGSGFKGGEVTPLFYVGSTLGHALANVLHAPIDLFAGLGLVAVFAAAARTPVACTVLAVELFGFGHAADIVLYSVACILACASGGRTGIYQQHPAPAALPRAL